MKEREWWDGLSDFRKKQLAEYHVWTDDYKNLSIDNIKTIYNAEVYGY